MEGFGRYTVSQLPQTMPAVGRQTIHMNTFLAQVEALGRAAAGNAAGQVVLVQGHGRRPASPIFAEEAMLLAARRLQLLAQRECHVRHPEIADPVRRVPDGPAAPGRSPSNRSGQSTWPSRSMLTTLILALAATLGVAGRRTARSRPAQPAPIAAKDAEVAAGRGALEAGRSEEALAQAEALLAGSPGHEAAAALKVEALLSLNQRQKALDAYDAWFKVSQRENPTVASLIGRAELEALKENALAAIRIDALAALARAGRADARNTLAASAAASPATPMTWPSTVAMASLGDAASQARIIQTAREASGSARAEALQAMAAGRVTGGEALLRESLASSDANLQAAAASSAADLGLKALVPDLERTAKQGDQFGRFAAALAAVRLGSQATLPLVEAGLTSPALDARLMAASAIKARGRTNWVAVARPLLENKDGLDTFPGGGAAPVGRSPSGHAGPHRRQRGSEPQRPRRGRPDSGCRRRRRAGTVPASAA